MTTAIKRYDLVFSEHFGGGIGAKENGKYCEYADYLEVLKRAEAAETSLGIEYDNHHQTRAFMREYLSRAKAAEARLAEYEKQEPIGRVDRGAVTDSNEYPDARVICLHEHVGWEAFQDGCELFTRPAPAISLAELVPEEITSALSEQIIDICDGFEVGDSGAKEIWKACRANIMRNIEAVK